MYIIPEKSRMYLSKLEIRGFKSFKDKEILQFPESFSAIIGPNGSGKTNIIDAICFVLGSSRNLRVRRLEELICNGGIKGEGVNSAKVSLYLREDGRERVKLSREINREGKSEYKLDGKKVLREEILDLLGDNEYNIIHQNDVTRMIDMKPVQRRGIIDDLCGLREYEEKKEKAMKELEKVEEKFSQTNIVLGEKRGYLGGLKGERDEALKYREIKEKLERCRGTIIKHYLEKERGKEEKIQEGIEDLQKDKDKHLLKIKKTKDEINGKTTQVREFNDQILKLEESLVDKEFSRLREDYVRGEEELEHLVEELKSLGEEIFGKKEKERKTKREREPLPVEIEKIEKEIERIKPKLESLGKKVKVGAAGSLQELKSNLKFWENLQEKNLEESGELERKREEVEGRLEEFKSEEKDFSREYGENKKKVEGLTKELEEGRNSLKKFLWEKKENEPLLEFLQSQIAQKKAELAALKKSPSQGSVAKAIMNIQPVVKGIYGSAQELGAPDARYEKALTLAVGGRIYAIGVENEDTAKKCIDYLRKKKIGRATFLPLNKLQVKVRDKAPQEAIGFARDFIKCQGKFKKIFQWVFGDTLIIKDIDAGKKIGIGKWPMVTLEGDLISPGGAISGGYVKAKKVFSTEGEVKKEIAELEKKIVGLMEKRDEQEAKSEKLRKGISELEENLQIKETEQEKIKLNLQSIKERISELENNLGECQKKLLELEKEIEKGKREIAKLQDELKDEEKSYAKSGVERKAEELNKLEEEYHQLSMQKNSFQEKEKFLDKRLREIEGELKSLMERKKSLEKKKGQTQEKISQLREQLEKKRSQEKGIESKVKKLMASREHLNGEINSLGEEVGRMEYQLESGSEKLNRFMIKKAKLETRVSDLEKEFKDYQEVEFLEGEKIPELEKLEGDLGREIAGFGFINMRAIENYNLVKNELDGMEEKLDTLKKEKQSILNFMDKVERKKREIFMETFQAVRKNFEEMFKELGGGKGTLKLDHVSEISKAGLIIKASPGGKKLINLDMMSGGEKVLTCAAFLLAVQRYKPSYFYILDELDAALDKTNSLKLAEMLRASGAQFILVTHNDNILKHAESVIGVSMQDGLSQVVGVKLGG